MNINKLVRLHNRLRQAYIRDTTMKSIKKEKSRCARDIWKFSNELFNEDKGNDVDPTFQKTNVTPFFVPFIQMLPI